MASKQTKEFARSEISRAIRHLRDTADDEGVDWEVKAQITVELRRIQEQLWGWKEN